MYKDLENKVKKKSIYVITVYMQYQKVQSIRISNPEITSPNWSSDIRISNSSALDFLILQLEFQNFKLRQNNPSETPVRLSDITTSNWGLLFQDLKF